jgi:hypothetical protein
MFWCTVRNLTTFHRNLLPLLPRERNTDVSETPAASIIKVEYYPHTLTWYKYADVSEETVASIIEVDY